MLATKRWVTHNLSVAGLLDIDWRHFLEIVNCFAVLVDVTNKITREDSLFRS